jgi:small subunit ribosomal protein S18
LKKKKEITMLESLEAKSNDWKYQSLAQTQDDVPIKLEQDPYKKKMHKCIFCEHNLPLDYKNVQLLSQFVSPQTGIQYSQQITGLCISKHLEVKAEIYKARKFGLMPFFYKDIHFVDDKKVFDEYKNNLKDVPNNYDQRPLNSE